MEDIAPGLLEEIRESFAHKVSTNPRIAKLHKAIQDGTATYIEAEEYAYEVGAALSEAFSEHLSSAVLPDGKMYFNIADRVLRPLLEEDHAIIADAAAQVQTALNQKAGIHLKARTAPVNNDRIDGIINKVSAADRFDDVSWVLDEPVKNFSQAVVDDTLKINVRFQGKSGLRPKIIRRAESKCCEWCSRLEGEYDYPHVPPDVYRRHERCRCTVDYDPGSGKIQNVHTKEWQSAEEYAKLEARKQLGLTSLAKSLADHPMRLASFTPESLKIKLEAEGLEVKPLQKGSLRNVPFAEGGGYKVNFEDGGLLQYHPAEQSHHGGAYYKISTGKGGTHRYDLDGNEIHG